MLATRTITSSRTPRTALLLTALTILVTLVAAVLVRRLAPGLEPMQQRFIAVLVLAVFATAVAAVTRPKLFSTGRLRPGLLVVPLLIVLAPFAGGLKDPGLATVMMIVGGYLATGLYEEFWFRGLVLESLSAWTPLRAALLSSALFGAAHLSNIAFGANPAVTAAQVVGAACFGMGLAALRLRGVSLWPLVIIHAVGDIALQLGDVDSALRWTLMVGGDILLLIFALLVLRNGGVRGGLQRQRRQGRKKRTSSERLLGMP